jgi:hypothetical protein
MATTDATTVELGLPGDLGPLRIGFVSAFPPGKNSLNEFGWHVVNALAEKDDIAEVVLFADATESGPPTPIEGVTSRVSWTFNKVTNVMSLARAIRKAKPDAVVFNLQFATFGDTKVAGGLGLLTPAVVKAMGIPTASILHNLVENVDMEDAGFAGNALMAKIMNMAGRFLTKAILRSDYVALTVPQYVELLEEQYDAENAILVPHGSFETIDEPDFSVPDGPRQLLAFGKWGTYKTVDVLIDAQRELIRRGFDDVQVVIAGTDSPNAPGYLEGVAAGCADLDSVVFTGYVEEEDVAPMFTSAAITVFPYTSTTGSSGVLHQAGSYGRCAVLPMIGDFAEVIEEEGFVGQYFEPGDAMSLADALEELLNDPAKREAQGRQNFSAAAGIPMAEVVDWHLFHLAEHIAGARKR